MLRACLLSVVLLGAAIAVSPAKDARRSARIAPDPPGSAEAAIRDKTNAWSIGFAAGLLEGAPIRFATERSMMAERCTSFPS